MRNRFFGRVWTALVAITISISLFACNPRIDRARADALAAARLQQYAKDEGLKAELFAKGEVREFEEKWLYSFDYPAPPRQSVAIIVSTRGSVEVTRMLEANR